MESETSSLPENLIDMKEAHRQLMCEQIIEIENRVRELESSLLARAAEMYMQFSSQIDLLLAGESLVEFGSLPESDGVIRVSLRDQSESTVATESAPPELFKSLKEARRQLEALNETIGNLELVR